MQVQYLTLTLKKQFRESLLALPYNPYPNPSPLTLTKFDKTFEKYVIMGQKSASEYAK